MLLDLIASEYKWSRRDILRSPLNELFCYQAAILQRHEVDTGVPSFAERDLLKNGF